MSQHGPILFDLYRVPKMVRNKAILHPGFRALINIIFRLWKAYFQVAQNQYQTELDICSVSSGKSVSSTSITQIDLIRRLSTVSEFRRKLISLSTYHPSNFVVNSLPLPPLQLKGRGKNKNLLINCISEKRHRNKPIFIGFPRRTFFSSRLNRSPFASFVVSSPLSVRFFFLLLRIIALGRGKILWKTNGGKRRKMQKKNTKLRKLENDYGGGDDESALVGAWGSPNV